LKGIYLSTSAILFFGTPHLGASIAGDSSLAVLARIVSVVRDTDQALINHLQRDSEWLQLQWTQYANISGDFDTVFFFETLPTRIHPLRNELVTCLCLLKLTPDRSEDISGDSGFCEC
jgi:hypothetical protein